MWQSDSEMSPAQRMCTLYCTLYVSCLENVYTVRCTLYCTLYCILYCTLYVSCLENVVHQVQVERLVPAWTPEVPGHVQNTKYFHCCKNNCSVCPGELPEHLHVLPEGGRLPRPLRQLQGVPGPRILQQAELPEILQKVLWLLFSFLNYRITIMS